MDTEEKYKLVEKIMELCGLESFPTVPSYTLLKVLDGDRLSVIYEELLIVPEEKRETLLKEFLTIAFKNFRSNPYSVGELRILFAALVISAKNSTKPSFSLGESNGVDISDCQCFTCKHKNDKEVLEGYYTGAFDAYKEAIEFVCKLFPDNKSFDWLKISSLLSMLNYEKDCSGALLEEVSLKKGK